MTLFTSVTKRTFRKVSFIYAGIAVICIIFTIIYESFSYGESSPYIRFMFLAPLVAAVVAFLAGLGAGWIRTRLSLLLFNSGIAILVSACLIKGIIEISGRTTMIDTSYWYMAAAFFLLSLVAGLVRRV